ncbi:MAG: PDZ domain-containing protein [Lachnospiraceae bacterium]|nr:PDZ domain-containing protein [Candidatus Minthocola equi]
MTNDDKSAQEAREQFIRETVASDKKSGSKLRKKILVSSACGLAFGIVACLTLLISKNVWNGPEKEPETSADITVFSGETEADEPTTPAPPPEEYSAAIADIEASLSARLEKELENLRQENVMYADRQQAVERADKSLVTVSAAPHREVFDDSEEAPKYTGVIIAKTDGEIFILTSADAVSGDSIYVNFSTHIEASAVLKERDDVYGIAVVAVSTSDVSAATKELPVIEFGAPGAISKGTPVIAVGMPQGKSDAVAYGIVSHIESTVYGTDGIVKLFQTDIIGTDNSNGLLLDSEGCMIGWITTKYINNRMSGMVAALSLSDMKSSIENLSNSRQMALLGIRGQAITKPVADENNMPVGIYVIKPVAGRAAEVAGVLAGDVITKINGSEVHTFPELIRVLGEHAPGDNVSLELYRSGQGSYQSMILPVTLQKR